MIASLKKVFLPAIRQRGFKGSLPHFRRPMTEQIDLLTIQFDKWGGGFVIEISKCAVDGLTTSGDSTSARIVSEHGMCIRFIDHGWGRSELGKTVTGSGLMTVRPRTELHK